MFKFGDIVEGNRIINVNDKERAVPHTYIGFVVKQKTKTMALCAVDSKDTKGKSNIGFEELENIKFTTKKVSKAVKEFALKYPEYLSGFMSSKKIRLEYRKDVVSNFVAAIIRS